MLALWEHTRVGQFNIQGLSTSKNHHSLPQIGTFSIWPAIVITQFIPLKSPVLSNVAYVHLGPLDSGKAAVQWKTQETMIIKKGGTSLRTGYQAAPWRSLEKLTHLWLKRFAPITRDLRRNIKKRLKLSQTDMLLCQRTAVLNEKSAPAMETVWKRCWAGWKSCWLLLWRSYSRRRWSRKYIFSRRHKLTPSQCIGDQKKSIIWWKQPICLL